MQYETNLASSDESWRHPLSGESTQRRRQYEASKTAIADGGLDITSLSPDEVVQLQRSLTTNPDAAVGTPWEYDEIGLPARLNCTLDNLAAIDEDRARDIFTAFAASPFAADRADAAREGLVRLTQYDHESGMNLWTRLMRDQGETVRDAALGLLDVTLARYRTQPSPRHLPRKGSGYYSLDRVDEKALRKGTWMTRSDARELLDAYAYAENGTDVGAQRIGRTVLDKLALPKPLPKPYKP